MDSPKSSDSKHIITDDPKSSDSQHINAQLQTIMRNLRTSYNPHLKAYHYAMTHPSSQYRLRLP